MTLQPVQFRWKRVDVQTEGGELRRVDVMVPHTRFATLCARQYELDEDYALAPFEGVPSKSRAALFAGIAEAWDNLPKEEKRFPSPEHLRKAALIEGAGWANHTQSVYDTEKDARKHALDVRNIDEYAIITRKGCVVDVWVAKSISAGTPGLGKAKFREISRKALDWVAELIGATRAELEANAGRAA